MWGSEDILAIRFDTLVSFFLESTVSALGLIRFTFSTSGNRVHTNIVLDCCSPFPLPPYTLWVPWESLAMPSLVCNPCHGQQNVLPDESLAPPLLDAGKRLFKFLQQRFGLFSCGAGGNNGEAAARPPSSCSYRSNDGDGVGGQLDDRRTRTGLEAFSCRSGHPMDDQGGGERGSGDVTQGAGFAGMGGLSLMQLELSEEDQPVVVPYEEVSVVGVLRAAAQRVYVVECVRPHRYPLEIGMSHSWNERI